MRILVVFLVQTVVVVVAGAVPGNLYICAEPTRMSISNLLNGLDINGKDLDFDQAKLSLDNLPVDQSLKFTMHHFDNGFEQNLELSFSSQKYKLSLTRIIPNMLDSPYGVFIPDLLLVDKPDEYYVGRKWDKSKANDAYRRIREADLEELTNTIKTWPKYRRIVPAKYIFNKLLENGFAIYTYKSAAVIVGREHYSICPRHDQYGEYKTSVTISSVSELFKDHHFKKVVEVTYPIIADSEENIWDVLQRAGRVLNQENINFVVGTLATGGFVAYLYSLLKAGAKRTNPAFILIPPHYFSSLWRDDFDKSSLHIPGHPEFTLNDIRAFYALSLNEQRVVLQRDSEFKEYLLLVARSLLSQELSYCVARQDCA